VRDRLKRVMERGLVGAGVANRLARRPAGDLLVLAYHNVVPHGESVTGEASLQIPQERFAAHLDRLQETADVVSLTAPLARAGGMRPRVAITFDDAYRGALTAGLEELGRRGLPATVFVSPAFVESGDSFWWDDLASRYGGAIPADVRDEALHAQQGDDGAVRRRFGLPPSRQPGHARAVDEAELARAAARAGVTLGGHGWSHRNMAALERAQLEVELERPLHWLRERFEAVVPWLAYPYGLSSPAAEAAAERHGYEGALRVTGGWRSVRDGRRWSLPRLNVPAGMTADGLSLRLAGLFCA